MQTSLRHKFFENIGNNKLGKYKNKTLSIRITITFNTSMSRIITKVFIQRRV
jgi:hypothetical protein